MFYGHAVPGSRPFLECQALIFLLVLTGRNMTIFLLVLINVMQTPLILLYTFFLQPPLGEGRVEQLGKWVKKEVSVSGSWWDSSCVDIAVAGLGWFAIGLKGEARLGVWTYDGVDVVVRNALLPQRSHKFEVAGFTVSEIVSKADRAGNKQRKNEKKRKPIDSTVTYPRSSLTIDAES